MHTRTNRRRPTKSHKSHTQTACTPAPLKPAPKVAPVPRAENGLLLVVAGAEVSEADPPEVPAADACAGAGDGAGAVTGAAAAAVLVCASLASSVVEGAPSAGLT